MLRNLLFTVSLAAGLLLGGSDGPYFPIPNLVGVAVMVAGFLIYKHLER